MHEAADGILAVISIAFSNDIRFQQRLERFRTSLDEARDRNHTGVDRPLAFYFRPAFGPGALEGGPLVPTPPPGGIGGDDEQLGRICVTFVASRSWEGRRRIVAAYPDVLLSDDAIHVIREVAGRMGTVWGPVAEQIAGVLKDARSRGLVVFSGPLPSAFLTAVPSREQPLLTRNEATQDAMIEFLDTPTWERRRRVLEKLSNLLLSDEQQADLQILLERYAGNDSLVSRLEVIARVLDRARSNGVEAAFSQPLPPTQVTLDLTAFDELARREVDDPIRRASLLRQAVHYFDPSVAPTTWAQWNQLLAEELTDFPSAELRAVYAEEALLRSQDALEIFVPDRVRGDWADAQLRLGAAYLQRVRGDPAANIERAINALGQATEVFSDEDRLEPMFSALVRLSQAYRIRLTGVPARNIESALTLARNAVDAVAKGGSRVDRAWAELAVGQALLSRSQGDPDENIEEAIGHLRQAAKGLPARSNPKVVAGVHQTLGAAYAQRKRGFPGVNLSLAVKHLDRALRAFSSGHFEYETAATLHAKGTAYFRLAPEDPEAQATALSHYRAALEVFTGDSYSSDRRRSLKEVGAILFRERRWNECLDVLSEAIALGDYLEDATVTLSGHLGEVAELPDVYDRAAYCLLQLSRPDEALVELDLGKTRVMRDQLEGRHLPAGQGMSLNHGMLGSLEDILDLVPPGGAMVVPVFTSQGSAVFLLADGDTDVTSRNVLNLPRIVDANLRNVLIGTRDSPGWMIANDAWIHAYLRVAEVEVALHESRSTERDLADAIDAERRMGEVAMRALEDMGAELWQLLMGSVHERLLELGLGADDPVVIVPSKWLSLIPLAASWRVEGKGRRYFLDDHVLSVAPSAAILRFARERAEAVFGQEASLLAIVNPTQDLRYAELEGEEVAAAFHGAAHMLPGEKGTATELIRKLPGRTHLHFACHGSFDWMDPLGSGLELADGPLTMADVASGLALEQVRLIALSACDSGVTEFERMPGEFLGISGALLQVGASCVVSSLWSVDDLATTLLMRSFYRAHLRDGLEPASAMRSAQKEVRDGSAEKLGLAALYRERWRIFEDEEDLRQSEYYRNHPDEVPFNHPYYWAAFTCAGA